MSSQKQRNFKFEAFKHRVEVDPKYADKTWRVLEHAIHEIYNHNASGLSFEELYRFDLQRIHPPPQNLAMACTLDFRYLDEGLRGQKNKRKRSEFSDPQSNGGDSMELDSIYEPPPAKRAALPFLSDPEEPAFSQPTFDGVVSGKVSGRRWKQVRTQRASAAMVSRRGTTMELRAKEKEMKRAYKERMKELKEEIRLNKVEKRKKREEREKKKQDNILRTGTKLQKITNPKTLKKIAKSKQKKLLKVLPDEILDKHANKKKNNA